MSCLQRTGAGKRGGTEQSRGNVLEEGEQAYCALVCQKLAVCSPGDDSTRCCLDVLCALWEGKKKEKKTAFQIRMCLCAAHFEPDVCVTVHRFRRPDTRSR